MPEGQVVQKTETLATVESLQADFEALGIEKGMVLLVHSSLSAIGWVCGGAVAVIIALQEVLGDTGTLVMPAHSTDLSDPSQWENPPVPESWWQIIRETMPAYDPDLTPTRSMGKIAETFRKQSGVLRSAHPQSSFCARGPQASDIINNHALAYGMGEIHRLPESMTCMVPSCSSVSGTQAIHPYILQNTERTSQTNASSRRVPQPHR